MRNLKLVCISCISITVIGASLSVASTFAQTNSQLTITTTSLPSGTVGTAYSAKVSASGGSGSYSWRVSSGALPVGLRLTPGRCTRKPCRAPAKILGTPTTVGVYAFTILVSDGTSQTLKQFKITVVSPSSQAKYFLYVVSGGAVEQFIVKMTDPATIQKALDDLKGERKLIVSGIIGSGNGGFNALWSWHLDPAAILLAEQSIEVCDGRPSYVESHLKEWLGRRYCPWSARVSAVYDTPPASALSHESTVLASPFEQDANSFLSVTNVHVLQEATSVRVSATISSVYGVKSANARIKDGTRVIQEILLQSTQANSEDWRGEFPSQNLAGGVYQVIVSAQSKKQGANVITAEPVTFEVTADTRAADAANRNSAARSSLTTGVSSRSAESTREDPVFYENKNKQSIDTWNVKTRCSCDRDPKKTECAQQSFRRGADSILRFIAKKSDVAKTCYDRYLLKRSAKSYAYTRLENPKITFDINAQSYSDPDYNRVRLSWNVENAATCSMSAEYKENGVYQPVPYGVPWLGSTQPSPVDGAASVNMDSENVPLEGSTTLFPLSPMRYTLSCTSPDGLVSKAIQVAEVTRLNQPVIDSASLGSHPYGYRPDKSFNWSSRSDLCQLKNPFPGKAETPLLARSGRMKFTMPPYDFDAPSNDVHSGFDDTDYTLHCFGHEKDKSSPSIYIQASEKNDIRLYGPTAMSFKVYDETGTLLANATSSDVIAIARHKTNQPNSNNATVFFEWETRNADICIASAKKYDPVSGEYRPVSNDIHWKSGDDKGVTSFLSETQNRSWQPLTPPLSETKEFARDWQPVYRAEVGDKAQYTLTCKRTAGEGASSTTDHRTIQVNFVE